MAANVNASGTIVRNVLIIVVGIIITATLLVPIIQDVQHTAGTPVTYNNAEISGFDEHGQYYTEDMTMVIHSPVDASTVLDTTVTVNDEQIHLRTPTWNQHEILVSDNVVILLNTSSSTGALAFIFYEMSSQIGVPIRTDLTIMYNASERVITVEYTDVSDMQSKTIVTSATSVFAVSNNQDYVYVNAASQFLSMYISENEMKNNTGGVIYSYGASIAVGTDTILVAAVSDRLGTRILGVVGATQDYTYTSSIEFRGLTLVDGTTDVYTGGQPVFILTVSDGVNEYTGEFVPVRSFIISEVTGHRDGGAIFSLYGVIPIMVLIAILMVAINLVRNRQA